MRALIIAIGLVLVSTVSAAQPTLPSLAWDLYPNTSAAEMVALYRYRMTLNGTPAMLTPTCVTECSAPIPLPLIMGTTYTLTFEVACAANPLAFGPVTQSTFTWTGAAPTFSGTIAPGANPCLNATGPPPPPIMLGPCDYQAPASTANPFPPMETRPIGQMLQGFNPIGASGIVGNQAERISQLKRWGWSVSLFQFVEGNLRADKIDRLFLIVECHGKPASTAALAGQV